MRVGILGSGLMGSKLGTIFARAGHEVVFSYAPSSERSRGTLQMHGRRDVRHLHQETMAATQAGVPCKARSCPYELRCEGFVRSRQPR